MALAETHTYTIDDIYALPDGRRAELIDGLIYDMAPPNTLHQRILMNLCRKIADYIDTHNGSCEVFPAPFAVFLNEDDRNYFEPDISVICDPGKITDSGCCGAPDWIIEIASPSTKSRDYGIKLFKYHSCGVKEYWVVNPITNTVNIYDFVHDLKADHHAFDDTFSSCTFDDFQIRIADLVK